MAFIAPLDDILRLVAAREDQPAATLGLQVVSLWSQAYGYTHQFPPGTTGVAIHRILEGGPGAKAELPKDVVVTHVNGQPTPDVNAFMDIVRAQSPGDAVALRTIAPGSHAVETFSVTVGELVW